MKRYFLIFIILVFLPQMLSAEYIAVIKSSELAAYTGPINSFKDAIKASNDIEVKVFNMNGELNQGMQIINKLVHNPPAAIFTLGAKASYLAVHKQDKIPVVFAIVLDYKKYKLKQNHSTGISLDVPGEIIFTQAQLIIPQLQKVGLIYSEALSENIRATADESLKMLDIELIKKQVNKSSSAVKEIEKIINKVDALWLPADPIIITAENFQRIINLCNKKNKPTIVYSQNFVKAGALMSLSPDYATIGAQAASIVSQIMNDKNNVKDMQVVPPIGTFFVVNKNAANTIGLNIDESLTSFIDKLIVKK